METSTSGIFERKRGASNQVAPEIEKVVERAYREFKEMNKKRDLKN